ncbi:MAG: cellulose biosynthesis cyclic di-GMP-binding regulatory protein BcsB [Thermostichus sp. DG02_4_bins_136]
MRNSRLYWGLLATGLFWGGGAEAAEIVLLQALGYTRPIVLEGVTPELNLAIPAPNGGVDPATSFVRLRLEPSPVLGPSSSVRVSINQEPVAVLPAEQLQSNPVVQVPIPALPPGERFINLSLQPFLTISGDVCQDTRTNNLFLKVGQDSFFQVVPRVADSTVADFFRPLYPQLSLVVPATFSPESAQAALWLYSLLAHQFPQTPIFWTKGSAKGAQVVLEPADFTPQLQYGSTQEGPRLRVAARPEAIRALMAEWQRPGLLSRSVQVNVAPAEEAVPLENRLSLHQLGFRDPILRGVGTQSLILNVDLAQFGGQPQDLSFHLDAVMTPVESATGDRLNGQVFWNGALVQAYHLTGRSRLQESLLLPTDLLRRTNTLELRFDYALSQGNCRGTVPSFMMQVRSENSGFLWSRYTAPTGELQEIPALLQGSGQLLLEDLELLPSAAYLLGSLSRLSAQPLLPTLKLLSGEVVSPASLGQARWSVIVAAPDQVQLNTPIRLGSQFEILNPLNQQAVLAVQPQDELGLLQYVLVNSRPTLWLSWWGANPAIAERLSRSLADPRTLAARQMQGNVVTAYAAAVDLTRLQSWDLTGQTYRVRYLGQWNWRLLLWRYRFLLVIAVALAGASLAWGLYRRLGQSPQVPLPPTGQ